MKETNGGVHSIGNGKLCAYVRGADVFDIIGPYYSTPSLLQLLCDEEGKAEKRRIPGSAVWDYSLEGCGSWRDFAPPGAPAFIRSVKAEKPIAWRIRRLNVCSFSRAPERLLAGKGFSKAWCGPVPAGTFFYTTLRDKEGRPNEGYPITDRLFVIAALSGDAEERFSNTDEAAFTLGQGDILIICAKDEDSAWKIFEELSAAGSALLCEKTLEYWKDFAFARTGRLKKMYPVSDYEISNAANNIAVLLKTQQDDSGGILAGCNYHLAYVRDNYGCFRGLMALGCLEEAQKLLRYYAGVHRLYGKISTAQGMGTCAFHVHEHDFAENTGYLVLMGMEYYGFTRDATFLKELAPLLRWALNQQQKRLLKGMLPFSGDETYIAGGILPRANIQDGSMEATLLYHRALELYLPAARDLFLEDEPFLKEQEAAMKEIAGSFVSNFIEKNVLYCNKPGLYDEHTAPKRRWGVMECGHGFGVSYRSPKGRYVCLNCLGKGKDLEEVPPQRYNLLSTAFMPLWVHSDLVPKALLERMVKNILRSWKESGKLPSKPEGDITVGYDYGLTLYAVSRILPDDTESLESLRQACLGIRDSAGAWVEYYKDGVPQGTPCRPWESAVNIAALLESAKSALAG
jgi:hypothetical protein